MHTATEAELRAALACFPFEGELALLEPLHRGHIHDTFVSRWKISTGPAAFLHQRINEVVFRDLDVLMRNIARVSEHMVARAAGADTGGFEPLRLLPAEDGAPYARTASGAWRTFVFIEGTSSYDRCSGPEQAHDAARAFGWFQAQLASLPPEELGETLPDFFSAPHRFGQFQHALGAADDGRRATAAREIEFCLQRAEFAGAIAAELRAGRMPPRIVHGDTKLNNILFDDASGRPRAIVDLDTCMPAWSLYDFGDLVRFTAATSAEDETDAHRIGTDLELYRALADGYLEEARAFLTPGEVELMPLAARLVTFTIGLRFLSDYLAGDVYFKIEPGRPLQNLDRARVQLGMVAFMEAHRAEMAVT